MYCAKLLTSTVTISAAHHGAASKFNKPKCDCWAHQAAVTVAAGIDDAINAFRIPSPKLVNQRRLRSASPGICGARNSIVPSRMTAPQNARNSQFSRTKTSTTSTPRRFGSNAGAGTDLIAVISLRPQPPPVDDVDRTAVRRISDDNG